MPYAAADFDDLVKKVDDTEYRLAHIQVHDDMYLRSHPYRSSSNVKRSSPSTCSR
jgi:hypothetical protein